MTKTTKSKIYIAGASKESDVIAYYMDRCRSCGIVITLDWIEEIRKQGGPMDPNVRVRRKAARKDLRAAVIGDATWVVQPENASTGAWAELGAVLGWRYALRGHTKSPELIVSGPETRCIFSDLADKRFTSHNAAFEYIAKKYGTG